MHFLSAVGSAITCGLLYLIIVDLMMMWRGIPSTFFERIAVYGSAIIDRFRWHSPAPSGLMR